jgi:hypothetical protein
MGITCSECVSVDRVIQHAMRMRCIVFPYVACLTIPHFPHYLINGTFIREKVIEHKMCILIFPMF